MLLFSLTLFWSAFLLFWVQLMVAKLILPLLGGSPAVWNTCLAFFQVALLLGYGYAHTLASQQRRFGVWIHAVLLALGAGALPLRVMGMPPLEASPIPWLLGLLAGAVGLPFVALAATAPLLQRWYGKDPYFLYVASNAGSLAGLLGYPLLIEPSLSLGQQGRWWAVGYGILAGLVLICASRRSSPELPPTETTIDPPSVGQRWRWVALAGIPSSLLLGVTNYVTTDVAAVPLLWAVPLAIYLVSFMLAFADYWPGSGWIGVWPGVAALLVGAMALNLVRPVWVWLPLHLLAFGLICWIAHAELARSRPDPASLTEFYWWVALGGCLGGMLNALVAPLVLQSLSEYPLALVLSGLLLPAVAWHRILVPLTIGLLVPLLAVGLDLSSWMRQGWGNLLALGVWAAVGTALRLSRIRWVVSGLVVLLVISQAWIRAGMVWSERSFFGLNRVVETQAEGSVYRWLLHGTTIHGMQSLDPGRHREPLTYFTRGGPIGQVFASRDPERVAVLGLGVGTLAAYAKAGQSWTFYEIDPVVVRLARRYFSFLADAPAQVVLGDARLALQRTSGRYDLMVMDAFSSDAIPVHLITREALRLYLDHLDPHGLLVFNLTNRFLNLAPVLGSLGADLGLSGRIQFDDAVPLAERRAGKAPSRWAVLARDVADLGVLAADPRWQILSAPPRPMIWTDDYSNLLGILMKGIRCNGNPENGNCAH